VLLGATTVLQKDVLDAVIAVLDTDMIFRDLLSGVPVVFDLLDNVILVFVAVVKDLLDIVDDLRCALFIVPICVGSMKVVEMLLVKVELTGVVVDKIVVIFNGTVEFPYVFGSKVSRKLSVDVTVMLDLESV
jgi:hypothetical protein